MHFDQQVFKSGGPSQAVVTQRGDYGRKVGETAPLLVLSCSGSCTRTREKPQKLRMVLLTSSKEIETQVLYTTSWIAFCYHLEREVSRGARKREEILRHSNI
jgi:hypothetical protein